MKHLDLFSGIGGFSLAAQWVWGNEHNIYSFVEIDPFCQKVLKKHWPNIAIISDIKEYKHDGTAIDLLTGGFPCQPFSCAGKQRGKEDDRYLWPEMLRVISEVHPSWIIGENVAGIINMGLDQVLSDLENTGYACQPFIIPACAVNAPHRRDRVWIVANSRREYGKRVEIRRKSERQIFSQKDAIMSKRSISNDGKRNASNTQGKNDRGYLRRKEKRQIPEFGNNIKQKDVADTKSGGLSSLWAKGGKGSNSQGSQGPEYVEAGSWAWDIPWLEVATRLCRVDDGIPSRVDRLKSLGNAIVPQVVIPIMQAIKHFNA